MRTVVKIFGSAAFGVCIAALPAAATDPFSYRASNITPADTHSVIAPALPAPPVSDNASPSDYLRLARDALAAGHTGEAQEALERAEARALDRAVPPFQTDQPIDDPLINQIRSARLALGSNNPQQALQLVTAALDTAGTYAAAQ
jgi:hypothetical protein